MNYTKTVWKDLPDTTTPLNASNLNHIEDGIKALYEKTFYSTTEQVVGTWIDGKPIYRKVINKTTAISANNWTPFYYSTDLGISNIDFIRVIDAILTKTGNVKESVWSSPARLQYLNGYLSIFVDSDVSGEQFIVEYTKTTD